MLSIKDTIRSWFIGAPAVQVGPYQFYTSSDSEPSFVDPTSALSLPSVYRATNLISNDIARVPAEFKDSTLERLWQRPNRWQSGFEFKRQMTMQALLLGNSFALINRNMSGQPVELLPLTMGTVSLKVNSPTPVYVSTIYGEISPSDMIHIRAACLDGLWAHSPIGLCKTAVLISLGQESNVASNVKSGGNPNFAILHPGQANQAARQAILAEYTKGHTGKNAGRPLVLSENARIEKLGMASAATDADVSRHYSISDISRIYGVPSSYLSDTAGSVYGSMEWLSRQYLDACLSHWFSAWAAEFEMKLGEAPLFDTFMLIRPSFAEVTTALRTAMESSLLTKNEARELMDYAPVPGGDEFIVALNMATGGGTSNAGIDTSKGNAPGDII